jgi:hypothetical protein
MEPGRAGGTPGGSRLTGSPLRLSVYPATTITNRRFTDFELGRWNRCFLPPAVAALMEEPAVEEVNAIEDDNRTAILPEPIATLDGLPFYLSVKGVGSSVDPFSMRRFDAAYATELTPDLDVRRRLAARRGDGGGVISGELWLRGSPYGGQGLPHAMAALRVSERADLTSLGGFRIAPVLKIARLPESLGDRLREIHWYRRYREPFVQELRLVPSNVRIYFHARTTVGTDPAAVFDRFGVDSAASAHAFEVRYVRSGLAVLTLFARTRSWNTAGDLCSGLDFQDVWLDKDAVLAPDGTVYFVDLEGIDAVVVDRSQLCEKYEDQIFRSLYEFMFAYEQIEAERARRFGPSGSRKRHFAALVEEALRDDPFVRPRRTLRGLSLEVVARPNEEGLSYDFPLVDA